MGLILSTTRALLDQHMRECREDRDRTTKQFEATTKAIDRLNSKIEENQNAAIDRIDQRHQENQVAMAKLMKIVWMAAGAVVALSFLAKANIPALIQELSKIGGGE